MERRDFLAVHREFNMARRLAAPPARLNFGEYSILCRLSRSSEPLPISTIASYQAVMRPTATHRTKRLADRELIVRERGLHDHRNIICSITRAGTETVRSVAQEVAAHLSGDARLLAPSWRAVVGCVEAMGAVPCSSGDLVLVALDDGEPGKTISELVEATGLSQPTVSMAASSLNRAGLVTHAPSGARTVIVSLTPQGRRRAAELIERIETFATLAEIGAL